MLLVVVAEAEAYHQQNDAAIASASYAHLLRSIRSDGHSTGMRLACDEEDAAADASEKTELRVY